MRDSRIGTGGVWLKDEAGNPVDLPASMGGKAKLVRDASGTIAEANVAQDVFEEDVYRSEAYIINPGDEELWGKECDPDDAADEAVIGEAGSFPIAPKALVRINSANRFSIVGATAGAIFTAKYSTSKVT